MEMTTQDYLKKALLDAQERVRDCMLYSEKIEDKKLSSFFQNCAQEEGRQAQKLQEFIDRTD
jgi:hypothetical protein